MKCEICHKADAETAIHLDGGGDEQELYVCRECAGKERVRRQKKSQRTRKATGLPPGVSMSVTRVSGEEGEDGPPPFIKALIDAVDDVVSGFGKEGKKKAEPSYREFPCERADKAYRVGRHLHLEGLHLIGELEAVHRAMRALGMKLAGVDADGVRETGHVYRLMYSGPSERAKRVVGDILREERNARVRLFEEMPRVFGDALCRALAILKNCRLLSPGEFFDLLSPLRLAAIEGMLDGVDLKAIMKMMEGVELGSGEDRESQEERDRIDAERADEVNARFENVVLNERAEGKFL